MRAAAVFSIFCNDMPRYVKQILDIRNYVIYHIHVIFVHDSGRVLWFLVGHLIFFFFFHFLYPCT